METEQFPSEEMHVSCVDGSIHFVTDSIQLEVFRAMDRRAGEEIVDVEAVSFWVS